MEAAAVGAGAGPLPGVTLDRLLDCQLNAQEAFVILQALDAALKGCQRAPPEQVRGSGGQLPLRRR